MINKCTFIDTHSSLENHTQFQTKMGKLDTRFQTIKAQKPTLWVGTYLYGLYKGIPPLPGTVQSWGHGQ